MFENIEAYFLSTILNSLFCVKAENRIEM